MGSIGDGIAGLFGAGSSNRGQHRDQDNAGNALDNSNQAIGNAQDWITGQGQVLGNVGTALQQQYNTTAAQSGAISREETALGNQNAAAGNLNGISALYNNAFGGSFGNAYNAALASDGFNADGSYNQSFDPYATTGQSMISKYSDSVAPQYDNAVGAASHDLLSRGITGANSILPSQVADIRRGQASDVANFGRNVGIQDQQEKYNRMTNGLNLIMGTGGAASQGYGNAGSAYGNVASGYGSQAGTQGQQAAGYGNNASGWGNMGDTYGNIGRNLLNVAGAYGNVSTGWQNGAQNYANQTSQNNQNLLGIAGLFS